MIASSFAFSSLVIGPTITVIETEISIPVVGLRILPAHPWWLRHSWRWRHRFRQVHIRIQRLVCPRIDFRSLRWPLLRAAARFREHILFEWRLDGSTSLRLTDWSMLRLRSTCRLFSEAFIVREIIEVVDRRHHCLLIAAAWPAFSPLAAAAIATSALLAT